MGHATRLAAVLVLALSTLAAAAGRVKDDAGFFSPGVAAQASDRLDALAQKYHHRVIVETFATLPPELQGKVDGNEASAKQAYNAYGGMRANSLAADVYVMIVRSPAKLEVTAANDPARSGLTATGRDGLRQELLDGFRAKRFDEALTGVTASLERTFANAPTPGGGGGAGGGGMTYGSHPAALPPPPGAMGGASPRNANDPGPAAGLPPAASGGLFGKFCCFGVILIGGLLFAGFFLLKRLGGGGNANRGYGPPPGPGQPGYGQPGYGGGGYGGGYPQQGGGGGFGRGIGGGILGGLAGSWLGNKVFGQSHDTNVDPNTGHGAAGGGFGTSGDPAAGADPSGFSTSGGDFGGNDAGGGNSFGSSTDAGGGSDFSTSGGDFGTSDSGGGDSGGGGGDSGGGGGDF